VADAAQGYTCDTETDRVEALRDVGVSVHFWLLTQASPVARRRTHL
jgi:hypothetical protein